MAKKASVYAGLTLVALAVLLASGYWVMQQRDEAMCGICQRHIHPEARVVADIGGHRRTVCCAHCAITEGRQEGKPVRLIEVTDYPTGQKLKPEDAWYVDGSRVVACEHDMAKMDEMKQAAQVSFDRCSPGTLAFHDRDAAAAFAAENGGVVLRLPELLREVLSQ